MITYFGIYLVYNLEHFGIFYSAKPGNPGRVERLERKAGVRLLRGPMMVDIRLFNDAKPESVNIDYLVDRKRRYASVISLFLACYYSVVWKPICIKFLT